MALKLPGEGLRLQIQGPHSEYQEYQRYGLYICWVVVMLSVPATGQKKDLDQGSVKVCCSRQLVMKIGLVTFIFQLS